MNRYLKFLLLILAGGCIYPMIYLRQTYETSLLEAFRITASELGQLQATVGVIFTCTYLPSGWLADRYSPRYLISFSLLGVGLLGFYASTFPSYGELRFIYLGWGITSGLTFWSALIKGVNLLAKSSEQGRFFGALDGGRGLVEALLASAALYLFAQMDDQGFSAPHMMQRVFWMYSGTCVVISLLIFICFDRSVGVSGEQDECLFKPKRSMLSLVRETIADIRFLSSQGMIVLLAFIIFAGYQLHWSTYSFSVMAQKGFGLTETSAGLITTYRLWTRPFAGFLAGILGDRFSRSGLLALCYVVSAGVLGTIILFPYMTNYSVILSLMLVMGFSTFALRGLFWSLLDDCKVPTRVSGLAVGLISFIGYLPDVILPLLLNQIRVGYDDVTSHRLYYAYIGIVAVLGCVSIWVFKRLSNRETQTKLGGRQEKTLKISPQALSS